MDRCRNEKDPNARRAALEMSLVIEDRGFDDYLIATMQNAQEPPEVRSGAILGLGLRKSHKAVPELIRLLTAPEGEIAVSAAYSLGAIGNKKGFRPLVDLLKRLQDAAPQNETLTEIVVFALQQMTGENRIGADHVGWEEWYAGHPQWRGSGK
jgi:HEAT repeat protein